MNKLVILMGPPGSGKSTYATQCERNGYLRISQDDQGRDGHRELFYSHVSTGRDIVIDRMNFDKKQRDQYRLEAIKNGYTVNLVEFVVPRQVCYGRCMERVGHPSINGDRKGAGGAVMRTKEQNQSDNANAALDTYFRFYEEVKEEEGELLRIQYETQNKRDAIMVDLDGTLCNLDHRLHYVKDGRRDWASFFRTVGEDSVYDDVADLVRQQSDRYDIVLCSGRSEDQTRENTERWLYKHNIPFNKLLMRPKMNYTRDDNVKAMLYRYEIKPYYNIKYVLDDRDQVVKKWREMGLTCFQVRPGNF